MMLFWAGLRGAVGVALAAGLTGPNGFALRATVLVVVVLTVIIFGGTTARMLEILDIRIGVNEEIDSDDEFDIEVVPRYNGYKHKPSYSRDGFGGGTHLDDVQGTRARGDGRTGYSTGSAKHGPRREASSMERRNSARTILKDGSTSVERGLLSPEDGSGNISDDDLDLPPSAPRTLLSPISNDEPAQYPTSGTSLATQNNNSTGISARSALTQLLNSGGEDAAAMFTRLDENFLKPHLLLDPGAGKHPGPDNV